MKVNSKVSFLITMILLMILILVTLFFSREHIIKYNQNKINSIQKSIKLSSNTLRHKKIRKYRFKDKRQYYITTEVAEQIRGKDSSIEKSAKIIIIFPILLIITLISYKKLKG